LSEHKLAKFKALEVGAQQLGISAEPLYINVNFTVDGKNPYGVDQKPCIDCGNCVCGCKVGAKNTLMMNYLPMAKNAGATILTQAEVQWIEKRPGGSWRVHGQQVNGLNDCSGFLMDAGEVILAAGSLNSTGILLRSQAHGLSLSPALGTKFSGNGDFFGMAYNGGYETDFLGYPHNQVPATGDSAPPGPNIVGLVRYTGGVPEDHRIAIEDFSFPSAYIDIVKTLFAAVQGERTTTGNEAAQLHRLQADLNPFGLAHNPNGAINHSMFYLVMGHDNSRGRIELETSPAEPGGCIRISWDNAGQQQIFDRLNDAVRRQAQALRANFISNPTWQLLNLKHLVTAHPLGGCPMADDYTQGVVDATGRVYAADGSLHAGLSVTDGSVVPSALGVNPLLTISALTERFIDKKIAQLAGGTAP
ncbi:MAG TPA: GMC oxidoreductase, partial [Terriglobia bacterium]